jgi:ORF6N domain-containing protein
MSKEIIPTEQIALRIRYFRGEKVLLDFDLAALYDVAVKVLNQSLKRNRERFPNDFMFQLSDEEARLLRSQFSALENRQTVENEGAERNWSQLVTSSRIYRKLNIGPTRSPKKVLPCCRMS